MKVFIVDDEPLARELLRNHLSHRPELIYGGEAGSGPQAIEEVQRRPPDILLLDVEMPGLDGFGVLSELGRLNLPLPLIIFVTAYDKYAVRAFEVNAVDYLLKPVTQERFNQAINRCLRKTSQTLTDVRNVLEDALLLPPKRLLVRQRKQIVPIPVQEIDWFEADRDYVWIHVHDAKFLVERTMTKMESLLSSANFVRIHRSAMVNLDRVRHLEPLDSGRYRLHMEDGTRLVVSRKYAPKIRDLMV